MLQIHAKNTYKPPFDEVSSFVEFEKWHVVRVSVCSAGDVLVWVACMTVGEWRTSVGDMLFYYCYCYYWKAVLKKKLLNVYFWNKNEKNVPNRFEQWFKRRTWLEEQVLVYISWTGNARILNISEFAAICPNVLNIPRYVQLCENAWICVKHYVPK